MNKELTNTTCEIIAVVGSAKSAFIEATRAAREKDIARAKELLNIGSEQFQQGHCLHADLLRRFANGEEIELDILLVHAECLLTSAEDFQTIARELIEFVEDDTKK